MWRKLDTDECPCESCHQVSHFLDEYIMKAVPLHFIESLMKDKKSDSYKLCRSIANIFAFAKKQPDAALDVKDRMASLLKTIAPEALTMFTLCAGIITVCWLNYQGQSKEGLLAVERIGMIKDMDDNTEERRLDKERFSHVSADVKSEEEYEIDRQRASRVSQSACTVVIGAMWSLHTCHCHNV